VKRRKAEEEESIEGGKTQISGVLCERREKIEEDINEK
jgi:hypothetical protein